MKNKKGNLILIGHTGSGKTTLGIELSIILKKMFFDSDKEIEKLLKISIKDIFKKYGEKFFRKKETEFLNKIINLNNIILSTGAGIISSENNINILTNLGIIIYLKSDIHECIKRVINDKNRPILNNYLNNNKEKNINNIFKKREYIYENITNITIDTNKKDINKIIKDIIYIIN